jgi:hypothetical protein
MKRWAPRSLSGAAARRGGALLLLVVLFSVQPTVSFEKIPFTALGHQAVSVWSKITIGMADAYSTLGERPIEDCLRPNLKGHEGTNPPTIDVDCFSIQQNFWISDSLGNFVLWAQNTVELAKLESTTYYGTYTFQVWNSSTARQPILCEPESSRKISCRAPFYTDPVSFPQSFIFYSSISNEGSTYMLQMSNNFGTTTWAIPPWITCPCYIGTVPEKAPPWGSSPFELVVVGLDSSAIAVFSNDTFGAFGPILFESSDGFWREAIVKTLRCLVAGGCLGLLATGEASMDLVWNSTSGKFYWSDSGADQGVYASAIATGIVDPPTIPNPPAQTYLFAELRSLYAYLTIYDEGQRPLGVNPQTGKLVEEIPNASITHDSSEDLLIVNPTGEYEFVVTSGGNTGFELFVSKATNSAGVLASRQYNGTLNVGHSMIFRLTVNDMNLIPQVTTLNTALAPVAGIIVALLGLVGAITVILFLRRKRVDD